MNVTRLLKIAMLNLVLVALIGVLMRYKIGFEFTWVNQKNLQLAHSGFAFSGVISFLLMIFIVDSLKKILDEKQLDYFSSIIYLNLLFAYTTCILFFLTGYGVWSVLSQLVGLIVGGLFIYSLLRVLPQYKQYHIVNWYKAAGIFYLLSLLANIWLLYMFVSGKKTQHTYLAATYWFLHFQYNGWFFFGCMGLFFNWLFTKDLLTNFNQRTFWLFAASCFPAYGLSVLWLELPLWVYIIIVVSAFMQLIGVIQLTKLILSKPIINLIKQNKTVLMLFFISLGALLVKVFLQGGSTIPFISKLAFGFRPIVIAYLHLVLLAFTSLFLIGYIYLNDYFSFSKRNFLATKLFALFVVLNEIVLGIQGIASLSYTVIPFVNEILLIIAAGLLLSSILMVPQKSYKQ
ncbi:MAG: hypothetical protein B7Y37_02665 [Sphingobacteriia bacterium 28-36-52]|nr:MAG: hypothetical protein B7Y37_02665 [Sphingobacteriia bacterium 28-36-52]